jgi:hypothetical protein
VLLPSDTNRKLITYITAVLVPFVSYLLTLVRITLRTTGFLVVLHYLVAILNIGNTSEAGAMPVLRSTALEAHT